MGLRDLFRRKPEPVEVEDEDISTDVYTLSLFEVIRRLEGRDEDDTANFYMQEELIDDSQ